MYNYKLSNNHYIVNIDGLDFLIDTGSNDSFSFDNNVVSISLNGKNYLLSPDNSLNINKIFNLVGMNLSGLIGTNIISNTGLTIYKNNQLDFNIADIEGHKITMSKNFPYSINFNNSNLNGKMIIDTGAKFGYGVDVLVLNKVPFERVNDYNPILGELISNNYHLQIELDGITKQVDVCLNNEVKEAFLTACSAQLILNITSLFDEVCVFDTKNGKFSLNKKI